MTIYETIIWYFGNSICGGELESGSIFKISFSAVLVEIQFYLCRITIKVLLNSTFIKYVSEEFGI